MTATQTLPRWDMTVVFPSPASFQQGYDTLLSSTGLADAATLAGQFGIDIRSVDFWRSSLDIVRRDIDTFEALVG